MYDREATSAHASSRHHSRWATPRICSDVAINVATSKFEAWGPGIEHASYSFHRDCGNECGRKCTDTNGNRLHYDKNNPLTTLKAERGTVVH
jgi:hypothetical protein